ncbi:MAG: hydrogen gas-evolving membrane-bound hydrogenase subunit E, partial [Planctomycetota bacterium]
WRPRLARLAPPLPNGRRIHEAIWNGMVGGGKRLTRLIQNGSLTSYVAITVIATCLLVLTAWMMHPGGLIDPPRTGLSALDLIIGILIAVGALATAIARHRLPAIAGLGVVGMGVTLFFLANHAPDLAMTQFLVEILSVVLLVVAFRHLPDFRAVPARTQLGRLAIALLVGVTMTLLVLVALSTNYNEPISDFHRAHAVSGGHGSNVVNVILVDFRALDTLGEISVLGIAAIGVIVLVGRLRRRRGGEEQET